LVNRFTVGGVTRVALDLRLGAADRVRARSKLFDTRRGGGLLKGQHEEADDIKEEVDHEGSHLGRPGSVCKVYGLVQLGAWEGSEEFAVDCELSCRSQVL
jgi:hypothetical protein